MQHRRTMTTVASVIAAVATLGLSAPAASARPLELRSPYEFIDEFSFDDCGFPVDEVDHYSGLTTIKDSTPTTGGQFFRFSDQYSHRFVVTNAESGDFVVITSRGLFRESPAKVVSDDGRVVTYRTMDSGAFTTVYDSAGRVIAKERGNVVYEYTFDTLGDSQPGGEFLSEELVRISGPHPLYFTDGCDLLTEWIG